MEDPGPWNGNLRRGPSCGVPDVENVKVCNLTRASGMWDRQIEMLTPLSHHCRLRRVSPYAKSPPSLY